jgi:hypothetical protein
MQYFPTVRNLMADPTSRTQITVARVIPGYCYSFD